MLPARAPAENVLPARLPRPANMERRVPPRCGPYAGGPYAGRPDAGAPDWACDLAPPRARRPEPERADPGSPRFARGEGLPETGDPPSSEGPRVPCGPDAWGRDALTARVRPSRSRLRETAGRRARVPRVPSRRELSLPVRPSRKPEVPVTREASAPNNRMTAVMTDAMTPTTRLPPPEAAPRVRGLQPAARLLAKPRVSRALLVPCVATALRISRGASVVPCAPRDVPAFLLRPSRPLISA